MKIDKQKIQEDYEAARARLDALHNLERLPEKCDSVRVVVNNKPSHQCTILEGEDAQKVVDFARKLLQSKF